MKAPCMNCFDRKLLCHGSCKRYQDWKAANERTAEAKRKESAATPALCRKVVLQIWREMKRK